MGEEFFDFSDGIDDNFTSQTNKIGIRNKELIILDDIKNRIGENNFFKDYDLRNILNIDTSDSKKLINEGLKRKILIEVADDEYAFSENTINGYNKNDCIGFSEYIKSNFVITNLKIKRFNAEETKLKENVLQNIAMKRRNDASESLTLYIQKNNFIYTTRDDNQSEMWIYQDGIYVPEGKSYIKEYCRKILGAVYTNHFVNEIISKIEADTLIESKEFFNQNYILEVPVQNGVLNIKTKELSIFNPKKIFFNKLPIIYNASAKCPLIEKHFRTILRDKEDSIVLFELFGYLLLKENRLEKAFMFVGNGRNGKSKTLELVKKFVGINNSSALSLSSMNSESFSLSELFGKMVNLTGDLSYMDLKETGVLKQLIGRDPIQTKRKFKKDLNFVNYAKLLFAANELPKIYDTTDGFWTKWILLEFPYKFVTQKEYNSLSDKERINKKIIDVEIIEKISSEEELSGLLNKALDSLHTILEQKEFSYSKGTEDVKNMWIRQSDSFMAFCMDFLEEDYENKISKKELRKVYFNYCKKYRLRSSSDKSIKITLENMFGCLETRHNSFDGYLWEGIKFKECQECQGISPYSQILNSPIGLKTLTLLTLSHKKDEIYSILEKNSDKSYKTSELGMKRDELLNIAKEGRIFEEKKDYWKWLG